MPCLPTFGGITVRNRLDDAVLNAVFRPVLLQKHDFNLIQRDSSAPPNDGPKGVILMRSWHPIEEASLCRPWDAAGQGLTDNDTLYSCFVFRVLEVKLDGAYRDCFPHKPPSPLEYEDVFGGVADGFVL